MAWTEQQDTHTTEDSRSTVLVAMIPPSFPLIGSLPMDQKLVTWM